ncbi:hydrocephalus-inducing protein homolog [Cinclus cinclus]|uniref:hydrocephalus-inducing protein homolog n=1 Tax=Cinclus cinclus TaxID=127875 RepID=UPI002E120FE5
MRRTQTVETLGFPVLTGGAELGARLWRYRALPPCPSRSGPRSGSLPLGPGTEGHQGWNRRGPSGDRGGERDGTEGGSEARPAPPPPGRPRPACRVPRLPAASFSVPEGGVSQCEEGGQHWGEFSAQNWPISTRCQMYRGLPLGRGNGCALSGSVPTQRGVFKAAFLAGLAQYKALSKQLLPVPPIESLLQVSPPEMVFQKFVAHEVSEMVLSLTNKDKSPRLVKVYMERSPYFELVCPSDVRHIILPGTSSHVRIRFTPDETENYSHELVCLTARDRIVVPIQAIAAQAILLDFPDQLDFSRCPVKYSSQKTLLVRNVGNVEAHYQLSTQSPFCVVPDRGTLAAGDTMQVTVGFHPLTVGDHSGSLVVCCNTGECIRTNLHGEAVDVNVRLSTNSVKVENTFITTSNYTTVFIKNRSNITAHFQWKTFPTEEDENKLKRRQCYFLQPLKEVSLEKFIEEENIEQEKGYCEDNTALVSHTVQEEMAKVKEDPMLFSDDIFSIEPVEGEIGPNCCAKIKVTFKPLEALEYRSVAYCNISGRESRLPLRLIGEGQGPFVELRSHTLNLGNIFVNTPYVYEVKLINQAPIDAPFTYICTTANVGYCFKFAPEEGIIAPGGIQTIQISFNATVLGRFEEEFQFSVAGSPTPAILTIKGNVCELTVYFNVDELNFGDVSFGFPYTMTCRLTNAFPVSQRFKLRMSDDGTQPAVSSFDQIQKQSDPSWRQGIHFYVEPREFTMNPSQGTIAPQGHQDIKVTLCSNTVMDFCRRMLVDLEGIGNGVASVTIMARCLVPELRVYPHVLLYDECRLKVPYERKFLVVNNTDLPGCYGLIPQKRKEDTPVFYSSPKPCGIVQPHSIAEIPVTIEVQTLGKHRTSVLISVFGDERNPRRQELQSTGQLADIYPSPRLIEFGMIPALQPNSQTFTLFNKRLVPTDFRAEIACKAHCYVIEPKEGVIPATGEVPVTITATLDDTGIFADTIQLFTGNSLWTTFMVLAVGTGTTIVMDKPFVPELSLGHQFRLVPCICQFKVTNRGHHFHRLFWSVECHSPPKKKGQSIPALSSPLAEDDCQSPKGTSPVFGLEPLSMELQPGESVDMVLRGFSPIEQLQKPRADPKVGADGNVALLRTEKIIETTITCKFIDPSIEISARQFSFWVEKKPSDDVLTLQYKPLALKNTCLLPLDLMLDLEQPFLLCDADQQPLPDGQPVTVDVGQTCHLYIAFDPSYKLDFHSWKEEKVLKINMVNGHPYVECITLRGEVHFPNLQIQRSILEFGCILAGTEEVRSLEITNCSPLPVQYHWSFHSDGQVNRLRSLFIVTLFSRHEHYPPKFKPQPPKEKRTCLDYSAPQRRRFKIRNGEDSGTALRESWDPAQSSGAEVFSVLPQSGVLQPGERQKVSFKFFGHFNTIASVTALCHVEGGPTYEVELTGEASCISYALSLQEINCGFQIFNEICHSTVTLANTGNTEFNWVLNPSTAEQHLPGVFLVIPPTGSVAPGEKQVLKFSYMPGVPGAFSRTFQLKVGVLDPENICLKGEAFFPVISVNLPWNIKGNEKYEKLIKPLQQYSQRNQSVVQKTQSPKTKTFKFQTPKTQTLKTQNLKPHAPGFGTVPNTELQIETVMMLIEEAALELQEKLPSHPPYSRFPDKKLRQSLVKVELPEYVLDMGTVRKGYTKRRTLVITNPGQIPVSFQVDVSALQDTGFRVNLDQMQGLPHRHTIMFEVCFESTHRQRGDVDVLLPIEVAKGPTYNIHLHATVLEGWLNLSKNTLQFSDTLVGQCQIETVQLYNWFHVPCKWFITAIKPVRKDNQRKRITPAMCQKQQVLEDEPCPFEVTPSKGTLNPGRWQNLQIQFTPKQERSYKNELKLNVCGSSNHLKLHLSGQGLEPRLEFSPPALKMGWVLVDSDGVDATVVVKNPCSFPVEFYSLDFDEQYFEEEKILWMAAGSEYQKNFLMPPCTVGGMLPPEALEDCEAQKRLKAQQAELKAMAEAEAEAEAIDKAAPAYHGAVTPSPEPMVEVTGSPISQAVMRHLGIDPSSERHEAQQDRGIVVIVHGPPRSGSSKACPCNSSYASVTKQSSSLSGKTEIVAALCHYYGTAHLSIDTMVKEAIANDQSQAGRRAQELCTKAAMELRGENQDDAGKKPLLTAQTKNKQASGGKNNMKKKSSKGKNPPAIKKRKPASKPNKKDTKQLNIISSHGEDLNCLSCVLPEDLLVDILCERLKHEDCSKGVVFDGLQSLFTSSLESSLLCVFKAVNNRHHIYMVNLHQDYASWKAKEEAEREKEEWQRKKPIQRSTEYVLQMDEDEDDALPEKKALVDKIIPERKCIQRERELKRLAQKLEEEAKALEEEEKIQGSVQLPVIQNGNTSQPSAENKLHKTIKPQEKVEKKPEQKCGGQRSLQSSHLETRSEVAEGTVRDEHVGVWCLDIQVTDPKAMIREILRDGRLPTKDKMLRHLGLHPEGPPLPPAAVFSVVNYPEEWLGSAECVKPFTIVAPEGAAMEDNRAKAPDAKGSSAEGQPKTHKAASRDNSPKENQISTHRTESPQDSSATRSKSVLKRASTPTEFHRLKRYRWIVPGHGEVELKVHFSTKRPGKFEHTLRFELVETKRQYELPCSGTGVYPSISQNPRLVFPQWRETMEADEIIFKEYVESTKQFHFGPLLCGKSREWYKARNCPGNSENLTILNNSPVDAEVQFSFENDGKAETFLLDPPSMTLKPKEKQELTIWAYPTSPGFLEDKLICCIEKNPDPVVFSLCCHGVHVMLEVSPLELSFDKLLLHRTDSRTLVLKNNTLLPMAWKLTGLDDLVEAFSLSQDNGIIDPRSEFDVTLNFKAEQIGSIEKTLRLEVSDTGNVLGIVQAEDIEISAEVCDVSLSIDMPEGPDGSLEFGTINVLENVKKVLSLKNKGMYNIEYCFVLKNAGPRMQDLASHFTIEPQSGMLIASQPGVNVEMVFHPTREMLLKNKPILYCQVTDASSGEGSQTVATIPVRVSAKAVYSKYSIEPASPINFGAMLKGTKKTQTVVLENRGMLNFKFHILQAPEDASALASKSSKQEESSPSGTKLKSSSLTQGYLSLGMFTVSPCSGSVAPWGQQKITVECLAGQEGTCEGQLYIDITGRDPKDNPLGIPFTLIAESCLPALVEDVTLTFEEYPICSSTNLSCKLRSVKGTGLFVREENKFVFTKVLVGQEAEAHFSVYNTSGLPCDVVLSNKPLPGKEKSPINNIFKLYPDTMSIPGSSNAIATVTFTPLEEQNYSCIFKASLVIPKSGKGHEPQVTVVCPSAHSKRGNAVLRFKRLRVGDTEMLPLVIHNNGIVPVKFMLHLEDEHGAFFLKGRGSTLERFYTEDVEEDCVGNESKPPEKPFFLLHHGQSTNIDVIFKPTLTQHLEGKICVLLEDIYSKKTLIELVGEGHKDEFTLDGLEEDTDERRAKRSLKKDIIDAVRLNHIQFGDCPVGRPYRRTFTITNHTSTKVMRFEWEADAAFQFSPKMGHLHPGCAKDITVTLKSDVPATFRRHPVKCKVIKTNSELPQRKVEDWEDRMCIVTREDTTRKDMAANRPVKKKMVQTAPEPEPAPAYTVDESIQEAKVYLSAVVGYTEFKQNLIMVQLKDTLPNQTRKDIFRIHNTGNITLEYSWMEAADSKAVKKPYSTTRTGAEPATGKSHTLGQDLEGGHLFDKSETGKNNGVMNDKKDLPLFSIHPCHGIIPPGQKQIFHVLFSPKHVGKFRTSILFRTHKLEPALKKVEVIVKGRAQEQECLDKPKRSALRQTDKGQGPKKQHPAGASNIVSSAADGLPPFTRDLCSYPCKLQ